MSKKCFDLLHDRWNENKFVCVGIDSLLDTLPGRWRSGSYRSMESFNRHIIEATKDSVCAYKLNPAFYLAAGVVGLRVLMKTAATIRQRAPGVIVILDGKYGDIRHTNEAHATFAFDHVEADAVTLNPLPGGDALQPFLRRQEKLCFVLCRTSGHKSAELQEMVVMEEGSFTCFEWYLKLASRVDNMWNIGRNCGLVVGASDARAISRVRHQAPTIPLLIPGIGRQGGDLTASVQAAKDDHGQGFLISVSRSVIFADDSRQEVVKLNRQIAAALAVP